MHLTGLLRIFFQCDIIAAKNIFLLHDILSIYIINIKNNCGNLMNFCHKRKKNFKLKLRHAHKLQTLL